MEMNESSRWTEEEMETAKKGEWFLAALITLDVCAGPIARVVGRRLTHALTGAVVWPAGARLCFRVFSDWPRLLRASVLSSRKWVRVTMLWGTASVASGASTSWPCRQRGDSAPGRLEGRGRACWCPPLLGHGVSPSAVPSPWAAMPTPHSPWKPSACPHCSLEPEWLGLCLPRLVDCLCASVSPSVRWEGCPDGPREARGNRHCRGCVGVSSPAPTSGRCLGAVRLMLRQREG